MLPTLEKGDHIFCNKFIYKFFDIKGGDIIIFLHPEDNKRNVMRRIMVFQGIVLS